MLNDYTIIYLVESRKDSSQVVSSILNRKLYSKLQTQVSNTADIKLCNQSRHYGIEADSHQTKCKVLKL